MQNIRGRGVSCRGVLTVMRCRGVVGARSQGRFGALIALALTTGLVMGCGAGGPAVEPATGVVTMDGSPVAGATVIFTPAAGGVSATGITGSDGRFSLASVVSGKSWPGAGVGSYTVTVSKVEVDAAASIDPNDPKYDPLASVNPGAGPKYVVPRGYGAAATSGLTATIAKGKNDVKFELDSKFKPAN